jgi:hypothetical protein
MPSIASETAGDRKPLFNYLSYYKLFISSVILYYLLPMERLTDFDKSAIVDLSYTHLISAAHPPSSALGRHQSRFGDI